MKNETKFLERVFVQIIVGRLPKHSMNFSEFAMRVWPDVPKKTAVGKFRQLRNPSTLTGKYQHLSLSDAAQMAEILDLDLSYLLVLAREEVKKQLEER